MDAGEINRRLTHAIARLAVDYDSAAREDDCKYIDWQRGVLNYTTYHDQYLVPAIGIEEKIRTIADLLDVYIDDVMD